MFQKNYFLRTYVGCFLTFFSLSPRGPWHTRNARRACVRDMWGLRPATSRNLCQEKGCISSVSAFSLTSEQILATLVRMSSRITLVTLFEEISATSFNKKSPDFAEVSWHFVISKSFVQEISDSLDSSIFSCLVATRTIFIFIWTWRKSQLLHSNHCQIVLRSKLSKQTRKTPLVEKNKEEQA